MYWCCNYPHDVEESQFNENIKGFSVEYSRSRVGFMPKKNPICVEYTHL